MDVWFKKVAWSYVPCSIEGFGVIFSAVAFVLIGLWVLSQIERANSVNLELAKIGLFVIALVGTLLIAKRHSA